MNQKLLWTTTALMTAALGTPSISYASPTSLEEAYPVTAITGTTRHTARVNSLRPPTVVQGYPVSDLTGTVPHTSSTVPSVKAPPIISLSPNGVLLDNTRIARVQPHELQGRMAATLYVRNVPVLTFISPQSLESQSVGANPEAQQLNEPIFRATAVARQLNQLNLQQTDAKEIQAIWVPEGASTLKFDKYATKNQSYQDHYLIKFKNTVLVEMDSLTRLPDTINDPAKDTLQATNRLRQLIGEAPPLHEISGRQVSLPKDRLLQELVLGPIRLRFSGLASWYSFHDNGPATASGETFDESQLTAAHRDLPFGTRVRVTNLQNGRSIVVRITDRGPYIAGRIIDLSTAAAGLLGMIQPGVAPVNVDVLAEPVPVSPNVASVQHSISKTRN